MNSGISLLAQCGFIALSAVAVYSFVTAAKEGEQRRLCTAVCSMNPDYAGRNRIAPDFELPSLDGRTVRLSDYRGKVVILNFWTKTCTPCLREMPSLNQLARVLEGYPDIKMLTITTDESAADAASTLKSVLSEAPAFPTLVDAESKVVLGGYGTSLYPETWIIDPQGIIRARIDGPRDWHEQASLTIDLARSISGPLSCEVEFFDKKPKGDQCNDIPIAG